MLPKKALTITKTIETSAYAAKLLAVSTKKATLIAASAAGRVMKEARTFIDTTIERATNGRTIRSHNWNAINEIIPDDLAEWIKSEYNSHSESAASTSFQKLYTHWAQCINEFVLFSTFGHIVVLQEAITQIQHDSYDSEEDRKLNVLAFIYINAQAARNWIEYISANFLTYLNAQDDKWLTSEIRPKIANRSTNVALLGRSLSHVNSVLNTLLRHTIEVEREASVMASVIEIQRVSNKELILDNFLQVKNYFPIALLANMENIAVKLIPGIITGKVKKNALSSYKKCIDKFDFLCAKIMPPLVLETVKNNTQALQQIVCRDLSYLSEPNDVSKDIRKALFRRILELKGGQRIKVIATQTLSLTREDIVSKILVISKDIGEHLSHHNYWEKTI
jgi:hypothetical protein